MEQHCITCMKGKLGRYKTKGSLYQDKDVARRPGEVWHGDLCGPFPASRNGYKYILCEAGTGYIKVYPIKRKSDTLNCLKKLYEASGFVHGQIQRFTPSDNWSAIEGASKLQT